MTEKKLIKTVNVLLGFASFLIFAAVTHLPPEKEPEPVIIPQETAPVRKTREEKGNDGKLPNPNIVAEQELRNVWNDLDISYQSIKKDYLGRYFITAYCPAECGGSWQTSSGATCHYSESWSEPTTCAIDRRHHGFGEIIQVGDGEGAKVYITEDTGPGVQGHWVDCFVETMEEVRNFNTRYDSVYRITYKTNFLDKNERKARHELFNAYLLSGSARSGFYFGSHG